MTDLITKPTFYFPYTKHIIFDTNKDNFSTMHNIIIQNRGYKFTFSVMDSNNEAYGRGATEFAYDKIFKNFINTYMIRSGLYFIDVTEDIFWHDDTNIEIFVRLIAMCISSGCILPFHLNPILLETISRKQMYSCEIAFFMEQFDRATFELCEAMSEKEFIDADLGYSKIEYYKTRIYETHTKEKQLIYNIIANYFDLFDSMYDFDICTIDYIFSGKYLINSHDVINICELQQAEYTDLWTKFVHSLNEIELRQMLYTFGNNYSLNKKYYIYVNSFISAHIVISTCSRKITLHEKLFENLVSLTQLKYYFASENSISDGTHRAPFAFPSGPNTNIDIFDTSDAFVLNNTNSDTDTDTDSDDIPVLDYRDGDGIQNAIRNNIVVAGSRVRLQHFPVSNFIFPNGDIRLQSTNDDIRLQSTNGDIRLQSTNGDIRLQSTIRIQLPPMPINNTINENTARRELFPVHIPIPNQLQNLFDSVEQKFFNTMAQNMISFPIGSDAIPTFTPLREPFFMTTQIPMISLSLPPLPEPIPQIEITTKTSIKTFKREKQRYARKNNNKNTLNRQNRVTNKNYHHRNNLRGRLHQ